MAYFDELVPDYTVEVPPSDGASLEAMRRLLFMFKLAINGHIVLLADNNENVVAVSPEFESQFDWTLEEFQALGPEDFFHADSLSVAAIHQANSLAAPYIARCYKKSGGLSYYKIQGLNVSFDGESWRMLSFVKI
jgi:hypothetical protein